MNSKPRIVFFSTTLRCAFLSSCVLAFNCGTSLSFAGFFTLTDDNSTADFDTESEDNLTGWTVDGTDHLFQQAFWFRIGNTAESSLHTLPILVEGVTDTNFDFDPETIFVRYDGGSFLAEVRYVLDGGAAGSGTSNLSEQVTITNTSASPLNFHFFQYVDFDLRDSSGGDSAVFTNNNAVQQYEGLSALTESIVSPVASHREIGFFSDILDSLNDAGPTTLSDTPAIGTVFGPGDVTWAFQWDVVIGAGRSFQISKDKNLTSIIPEPASALLLIFASLSVAVVRRRSA